MDRLEVKFAADVDAKTGEFSGYGAVFGNIDSHGDVVAPGAFKQSLAEWRERGSLPPMKLMHGTTINPFGGSDLPVGVWRSIREDDRGLHVEGKLSGIETDFGKRLHALISDGALGALSVGYRPIRATRGETPVKRKLETLKLIEVSLVPEGSNPEAIITGIKAILDEGRLPSVREFEDFLRDAGGFSKSAAIAIATAATPHLRRDSEGEADELAEFLKALRA